MSFKEYKYAVSDFSLTAYFYASPSVEACCSI